MGLAIGAEACAEGRDGLPQNRGAWRRHAVSADELSAGGGRARGFGSSRRHKPIHGIIAKHATTAAVTRMLAGLPGASPASVRSASGTYVLECPRVSGLTSSM